MLIDIEIVTHSKYFFILHHNFGLNEIIGLNEEKKFFQHKTFNINLDYFTTVCH